MKPKVRLIKKEDRKAAAVPVEATTSVDPREWTSAVKEWVSDFEERRDGPLVPFDSLFEDSKP
jgi:hypothetical protein